MTKRFIYFYYMKKNPSKIQIVAPSHSKYWKKLNLEKYTGGPFSDRSGGLITFGVENIEKVKELIKNDPFVIENLIEEKWVKEWVVE